jgi:hypothetical protein
MKIVRGIVFALCAALLGAALVPGARADQWDKKVIVTFSMAVAVPGHVLPAGTYVFKLVNGMAVEHVVQIWNEDETELLATTLTVPITRTYEPARSTFEFDDRAGKSPVAIKAWFYPADNTGEEFVYSRTSDSR